MCIEQIIQIGNLNLTFGQTYGYVSFMIKQYYHVSPMRKQCDYMSFMGNQYDYMSFVGNQYDYVLFTVMVICFYCKSI